MCVCGEYVMREGTLCVVCLCVCLSDAEKIWPGSQCHLHGVEDELGVWIAKDLKLG